MINTKDFLEILPHNIRYLIENIDEIKKLQEIRIKTNRPVMLQVGNREIICDYIVSVEDIKSILMRISNYSIYAFSQELKQGYITIKGGHRIGICGTCVIDNNRVKTIKDIASLNIRMAREVIGCSNNIIPLITCKNKVFNTIIISPPRCGKTTLIRDIARNLSEGIKSEEITGRKVCIVDERSEIAGCYNGIPQMNVGIRTDVLDGCPKSEGIMMAIRSMSPDVIICDEIGTYMDVESLLTALNSGVNLITTIHGSELKDLYNRVVFKELIENNVFQRAVFLSTYNGAGTVEYIYDTIKKETVWRR